MTQYISVTKKLTAIKLANIYIKEILPQKQVLRQVLN